MSQIKHTPAPWTKDSEFGTLITGADGGNVASVLNPWNATKRQFPVENNGDKIRANASLIAAAPDLLAVLRDLYEHGYTTMEDHDRVRAIIEKAEGRDSDRD